MTAMRAVEKARTLRGQGKFAEALEVLSAPSEFSGDLCGTRGAIEFAQGRFADAALSYSVVAVTRPDDARAHFSLALCLERAQRWDAAAGAFERALDLDPGYDEARQGLGACLLKMNRAQDALTEFNRLPGSEALLGTAVALHLLQRFDDARKAYEKFVASRPDSTEALANWIALSVATADYGRVGELSERLLALVPGSKIALQGLAVAASKRGDHDAAASYRARISEPNPVQPTPPVESLPDFVEAWHNLRIAIEQARFGSAEREVAMHHGGEL